ncbi:hypothetical protein T4D_11818 [Trichinella pseudospiralis]|uniref:Uncharacterized protein n=1 Tax=Trichinella pseudospiralis TaxID=6337 RepID=A0A0V1G6X5_TRIPS|nr:hypothetical protein T4D_11818 [Trichinella pseudospiralis]
MQMNAQWTIPALVTGCFTEETNSPDLQHDSPIAISKAMPFDVVYGFLIRRILLGSSILYIPACFSSQHLKRVTLQMNLQQTNTCFRIRTKLPESKARSADCHIDQREQCHSMRKRRLLICKHAVAIAAVNNWKIDSVCGCFANEPNYQDLNHDSITMLFRGSNAIREEKMSWMICRCICNRRVRALETGCLRSEPGSAITVSFRESNAVRCDKFVDLQNFLTSVFLAIADEFATDEYML